jgi:RNA polymerase sigma-70 factor (ECF subfamily)
MTTNDTRSATLDQIGGWLRLAFAAVVTAPLPDKLQALLDQLGDAGGSDARFRAELAAAIPHLRGYGRSLCGSADLADDLVQETMLKAWLARDRFVAGSSMRAWTHVILRNAYFTIARRTRFRGEWDEHAADLLLAVPAAQDHRVALGDLHRALMQLPPPQREALIMMGASGMSCEEVAEISQCAVGTVKSRVARARAALRRLIDDGQLEVPRAAVPGHRLSPLDQIMLQAQQLASRR